jgi:hypothetical protein
MARHPKPRKPERSGEGKLKIGGDLQGEPIFCFPETAAALTCQKKDTGVDGLKP